MRIAPRLYDEIVSHARAEAPNECCGMISARHGTAVKVYRATNTEASPLRFVIDGQEQIRFYNEIELAELELGAIYHSHTRTEPKPSQTDIGFAASWPGVDWIIVGLASGEADVRSWQISDGQVAEAELLVS